MTTYNDFPRITTVFDSSVDHPSTQLYNSSIRNTLRRILPGDILFSENNEQSFETFCRSLPLIKWTEWGPSPSRNLSIFLLCRYRPNGSKFFYDIISRWLIPEKRLNVALFFSTDFKISDFDDELYTISEIVLCLDDIQDLEMVRHNLPILEPEIRLGAVSVYHASRIMEIKGLSIDEKTSLIQEKIASLIQRRPKELDYDIFNQMQQFLVMCREEFKAVHEYHHMARLICIFYLFRKILCAQVEAFPSKRHLCLKIIKTRLHHPFGIKKVLAIFVSLNFLKENEIFEQKHLVKAIHNYIPNIKAVEDSFFIDESRDDSIQNIYLEIEKESREDFTLQEIQTLRKELPEDLKSRVEQLMRPIFMPRNEEEVMRHIVTLSQQLKYVRDLPQVVISFDEQTAVDLCFTIILVRVLTPECLSIQELFQRTPGWLKFIPDRLKRVGVIRNKYPKEATVFRVRLSNTQFLREDHSVDLFKARQEVIVELQKIIGEVRDFNGGMIAKQLEIYRALRENLGDIGKQHEFLLENFFHSLFPVELRSVLNPEPLKTLFLILLSAIKQHESLYTQQDDSRIFILIPLKDDAIKQKIFDSVENLNLLSSQLVCLHLDFQDTLYLGYIYFADSIEKQNSFLNLMKAIL